MAEDSIRSSKRRGGWNMLSCSYFIDNPAGISEEVLTQSLGVDKENEELIMAVHVFRARSLLRWCRGIYSSTGEGRHRLLMMQPENNPTRA
jgi:hypothetical protein